MNEKKRNEFANLPEVGFNTKLKPDKENTNSSKNKIINRINYLIENHNFRFNVVTQKLEIDLYKKGKFEFFQDRDFHILSTDLSLCNLRTSEQQLRSLLQHPHVSTDFHPFKDYIFNLIPWDKKTDYIEDYLNQVELENENLRGYFVGGFKKWLVAAVVSLIEDEPKKEFVNQTCLVLVGGQGKFKSTFLGNLVPEHLKLHYFYSGHFLTNSKDHEEMLGTKIVIDLDEMSTVVSHRTEIESLKSKITQDQISLRRAYGKGEIFLKRRASFCGSINTDEFLSDLTGTRRFLVYKIKDIKLNKNIDIGRLYAQALELYKEGFKYWIEREDIGLIEGYNSEYKLSSVEEDGICRYFIIPNEDDIKNNLHGVRYMSSGDINNYLADQNRMAKLNINNSISRNIGLIMKKLGFASVRKRPSPNINPRKVWIVRLHDNPGSVYENEKFNETLI